MPTPVTTKQPQPPAEQYVALGDLTVWARKPPHEPPNSSKAQTKTVQRGKVLPHPEWIGEDADESAAMIQALLDQGAIARKADVDSGDVTIPAESAVDELGQLRPVEQRPPTVLMKINRLRELNREGPIQNETYGPGGKPLVMREVQPIDARTLMPQSELVPAARQVR